MTAIHETAYPRVRSNLTEQELRDLYTPTADDAAFVARATQSPVAAFGCMVLVKTFQRLGYFTTFEALPPRLIAHLATTLGVQEPDDTLQQYEQRRLRGWHLPLIRGHLEITAFGAGGRRVLVGALLEATHSKDILADLINVGIEALVRARYELPAFSTLRRAAQHARSQVNLSYYRQVHAALDEEQRAMLTRLLTRGEDEATSLWQRLKREPKQPTTKRLREYAAHVRWLQSLNTARAAVADIPEAKLQRFADEARALNVAWMNETPEPKRCTLAVALLRVRTAQALDDVAEMFIRRVQKLHQRGKESYGAFRELGHVVRTLFLLRFLNDEDLRRTIHAATNITEAWNAFVQWVAFGSDGVIRQNNREEQRKIIRYNHLVANLVVFHNVVSMTRVLQEMIDEGYTVTPEIIARLSPYKTEHVNRFGSYELRFDQIPPPVTEELRLSPARVVKTRHPT